MFTTYVRAPVWTKADMASLQYQPAMVSQLNLVALLYALPISLPSPSPLSFSHITRRIETTLNVCFRLNFIRS